MRHLVAKGGHRRVAPVRIEFAEAGVAVHRDQAEHGAHRELGLVNRLRVDDRAEHVDRALMHERNDALHVLRAQTMLAQHLLQRIRGRMRMAARRVDT